MSYFKGIKVGDRVWDFKYGWGEVINIKNAYDLDFQNFNRSDLKVLEVKFINPYYQNSFYYTFDGVSFYDNANQTLFWDEVKIEIPSKPEIKLKNNYSEYIDENNFGNNNSIN